tara:strand:+ start:88 stop:396 length:309 start_codon:yes stop_codon:yes gene_type:complete
MDNSSPLEKLTLWIYENKKIFNSAQYIHIMQLIGDAYKQNDNNDDDNRINNFDYARYRLYSENDNDDNDEQWSGTDEIDDDNSSQEGSEDESTYTGKYINRY